MLKRTVALLSFLATSAAAEIEYDYIAIYDGWYVYTDGEVCWTASQSVFPVRGEDSPKVQVTFYDDDHMGELSVYDPAQYGGGADIAVKANGRLFPLDKDAEDPEYAFDNTDGLMGVMSETIEIEVQFTNGSGAPTAYRFSLKSFNAAAGHARYHCSKEV